MCDVSKVRYNKLPCPEYYIFRNLFFSLPRPLQRFWPPPAHSRRGVLPACMADLPDEDVALLRTLGTSTIRSFVCCLVSTWVVGTYFFYYHLSLLCDSQRSIGLYTWLVVNCGLILLCVSIDVLCTFRLLKRSVPDTRIDEKTGSHSSHGRLSLRCTS